VTVLPRCPLAKAWPPDRNEFIELMKKKILVVEDNPLNTELVTDLLVLNNFTVFQARSAEEGIETACQYLPDLIIMDINLPGMDGLCAARALKSKPATQHIPIVALTAHAMKGDDASALSAGCDGYLSKPIDTRTFVETVAAFLPATPVNHA
jgi:CheY-like chemotaxis protein